MSVRPIVLYPDPILRQPTREVESFDPGLVELVEDLRETMYDAPGVGLAAPQIGDRRRVAVVDADPRGPESRLHVLVNPRLVERSGAETDSEGCLSIPGFSDRIERPLRVRVAAQRPTGEPFTLEAEGFLARAICHEIDHLEGILIIDRLHGLRRQLALRRLKRLGLESKPGHQVLATEF